MTPSLRDQLAALVRAAEAANSSYRPAVAAYLYEAGLGKLWAGLFDADGDEAIVLSAWRLMLDTVASRRFGVSSEAWRVGDYPDRYFPVLWLDVLPAALPRVAPERRAAWLSALFNLGENLPAAVRSQSNQLAALLAERVDDLVRDLEGTLAAALAAVGLVQPARLAPEDWTGVRWLPPFDLGARVEDIALGDVVRVADGFLVRDVGGAPRVALRVAGDSLAVDRDGDLAAAPVASAIRLVDRALHGPAGALAEVPGIAPAAAVADDEGEGVVLDVASLWLRRFRAVG